MTAPVLPPARRAALQRQLLAWWDAGHRDLPWRFPQHAADPYRVWLAEVMLQQTQVATATPYYRRFLARWPTLEALAAADDAEVFAAWSGLGYYARCRNLLAAARAALAAHGGLPRSLEALRALPGFGPYTAGAVASIAFALPAAAVDGNVARVLARLFLLRGDPARPEVRARLEALAAALVHPARPGDWNQALMELGATVCARPAPACGRCPLARGCEARRAGAEREVPQARQRAQAKPLWLACAVVERGGAVWLERRPSRGLFAGLRAFPAAEGASAAAARRALAAWAEGAGGGPISAGAPLAEAERLLTHRRLRLAAYRCRAGGGVGEGGAGTWVPLAALTWAGLPAAMQALVASVLDALQAPASAPDEKKQGWARNRGRNRVEGAPSSRRKESGAPRSRTPLTRGGRSV
ncbi:MAG: A/G-specific adenine glycosylase [Anaeromyxobacter sp.]